MDVFSLSARIGIDTSEYERDLDDAVNTTSGFADKLKNGLSKAATAGAAALGALKIADKFKEMVTSSLASYAEYEQLVGGIETLFKDSSDTMLKYAQDAYKTAGLSANEYMETVTGFAASLIQSTGRGAQQDTEQLKASLDEEYEATKQYLKDVEDAEKDSWDAKIASARKYDDLMVTEYQHQKDEALKTLKQSHDEQLKEIKDHNEQVLAEAEAANNASTTTTESLQRSAEIANQAVIDMADNSAKMGTSMESIQNAYQGFSKQNYTINLMSAA